MTGHCCPRLAVTLLLITCVATWSYAQVLPPIGSIEPDEALAGAPITVTAQLLSGESVERLYLLHRPLGEAQFQQVEMDLVGNMASITLPSKFLVPPLLEYYFVIVDRNGEAVAFPPSTTGDPFSTPPIHTLTLPIRTASEGESQILFLSPDPSDVLNPEDVVVSVSLLRIDSLVVPSATEIYLDGANVTPKSILTGDMIIFIPENAGITLSPGVHKVGVRLYARDGNLSHAAVHRFVVRGETNLPLDQPVTTRVPPSGTVYAESRFERVSDVGTWYNRGGFSASVARGDWRLTMNTFLTSDEQSNRQPQNRFFIGVESPWISAGYGDGYPAFPNLILSGKRVRGLHTALHVGFFNLDLALGETVRPIDGVLLKQFSAESLRTEQQSDPSASYAPIDSTTWGKFRYGTFERTLFAVRPSFGSGQHWQLGFTWLTSRDDRSSISYGIRPQENVVVGTDFLTRIDEGRIEFAAQAAFSMYNSDISSGTFTDAYIDSVYDNPETVKNVRDILSPVITVNDNLRPLSLDIPTTLAYDLSVNVNYFNNVLRAMYIYRGSDYTSFGQTFLRKDIRGFNILDRLRLVENQVMLTLGYERLEDNTSRNKIATTAYTTTTAALSYSPRPGRATITAGTTLYTTANGLSRTGKDSLALIDDSTVRWFLQASYDFDLHGLHTASLNASTSNRDDRSVRKLNVTNTAFLLGLASRYSIPLQTFIDLGLNLNDFPSEVGTGAHQTLNYTTLTLGARYFFIPDAVSAAATVAPTFGELQRTVIDTSVEWLFLRTMTLTLQISYYRNTGIPNDSFLSLRYRTII